MDFRRWRHADRVDVRLGGHKRDQLQEGSTIVRTRSEVNRAYLGLRTGGGAVALVVELVSCHPPLPGTAPLISYRSAKGVRTWGYGQALRALKELVSGTGGDAEEYMLHSWWIGRATALAAGGSVSERVIKREGRWKSDAYRIYTRNNLEDSENVSRRLASSDREREYKTTRPVTGLG